VCAKLSTYTVSRQQLWSVMKSVFWSTLPCFLYHHSTGWQSMKIPWVVPVRAIHCQGECHDSGKPQYRAVARNQLHVVSFSKVHFPRCAWTSPLGSEFQRILPHGRCESVTKSHFWLEMQISDSPRSVESLEPARKSWVRWRESKTQWFWCGSLIHILRTTDA
jgi:hypothetical protein